MNLIFLFVILLWSDASTYIQTANASSCSDSLYTFNGDSTKTCEWIAKDPTNRCEMVDSSFVVVKDRCRETCNNCWPTDGTKRMTGQFCTNKSDCASGVCEQNTCYASEECKAIKQPWGSTFDRNKIILVFVGSGFDSKVEWQEQVVKTYNEFNTVEMFRNDNVRFNAFYVDTIGEGFCEFGCRGVDTLLCCEEERAKYLANKCFPSEATLQTIVVHNDYKYGGAGYRNSNIATTSRHKDGGLVAVHELGHSLFELGDEYTATAFTSDNSANCDIAGCPKWADLDEHVGGGLCKPEACKGGNYYKGGSSFMTDISKPVGAVNLRFTCCTFLAFTMALPSYCDEFEFGEGLVKYCKNDYQNYGGEAIYQELYYTPDSYYDDGPYEPNYGTNYILVQRPVVIILNLVEETFAYSDEMNKYGMKPAIHRRRQYLGDFKDILEANRAGHRELLKITVHFDSGDTQAMLYEKKNHIASLPSEDDNVSMEMMMKSAEVEWSATMMEIVVDGGKGLVESVEFEDIETTRSMILKAQLRRFFSSSIFISMSVVILISALATVGFFKHNGENSDDDSSTDDEEQRDGKI